MSEISEFIVSPSESKGDDIGQKGHHHNLSEVTRKKLEDNSVEAIDDLTSATHA